jgi:hybrid polyketide synthase / nonribosomal peptide synthetase ACE1
VKSHWPQAPTLSHRVDDMIATRASSLAISDGSGTTYTYDQMGKRVNTITAALKAAGCGPGKTVAVLHEPGKDLICSILGILRIGAIYVPLDSRNPMPRLMAIVEDLKPHTIIGHSATMKYVLDLQSVGQKIINTSSLSDSRVLTTIANEAEAPAPAIILYTSGTTGTPKGVIVNHSSLVNKIEGAVREYGLGDSERMLQQSALTFDVSVWQIFLPLVTGGFLYVVSKSCRGDPVAITDLICSEEITITGSTPAEYISWLNCGSSDKLRTSRWRLAISGGEMFGETLQHALQDLKKPDLRAFNNYGPTEVTHSSTMTEVKYVNESSPLVPAGFTQGNYSTYIVDDNMQCLPVGFSGEICVGGAGVAAGYLNQKELTKRQFLPDKFASADDISKGWGKMYRTGDKGRLGHDGALFFEGRIGGDSQIKLRGLRIELEDIEKNIVQCSSGMLIDAIVTVRGDPEYIVGYVVFAKGQEVIDQESFLDGLVKIPLPAYMIPTMLLALPSVPITTHGKKDRAAIKELALPQRAAMEEEKSSSLLTELELRMRNLWGEVLSKDIVDFSRIENRSDFFHVGGNSLLLIRLQKEIQETFHISVPLAHLFETPTLGGMVSRVKTSNSLKAPSIDWDTETALSPELNYPARPSGLSRPTQPPKSVVLTGSTGFLGRALLEGLIAEPSIQEIHCIAVRSNKHRPQLSPAVSPKIHVHEGDLTLPSLGLSSKDASSIFDTADVIVHNGADVSFLKNYRSLAAANVSSTKELLALAKHRSIPFHYISTAAVAHLTPQNPFAETSSAAYHPPADGSDGYTASKWASEVTLEKAAVRLGVSVWIHRPSTITGDEAPELDIMHNLLKFSRAMRAVPNTGAWEGYLDLIDVRTVAKAVVGAVVVGAAIEAETQTEKDVALNGDIRYVHQTGETVVLIKEFKDWLERESGGESFETLELGVWAEKARKLGLSEQVATYLSTKGLERLDEFLLFPRLLKGPVVVGASG